MVFRVVGLSCICAATHVAGDLLPIFFMHGIDDNHKAFDDMQQRIRAIDPDVVMYSLPVCDDKASLDNLWDQGKQIMDRMREKIAASPDVYKDGYVLLAHSQGALISRTVVERMDDHNIHTFISLAGPQMGEFGIPNIPTDNSLFQALAAVGKDKVYTLALTGPQRSSFQSQLSVANYWNDPRPKDGLFGFGHPHADYLSGNTFLPVLNNNPDRRTQGPGKPKSDNEGARYKANFVRLQQAVFTAGTADEMVFPWNSGLFEFYDETGEKTVPLHQTPLWNDDWLGLRELSTAGRLNFVIGTGVCHTCWAHDGTVFEKYIKPYLPTRPTATTISV